MLRRPSLGPRRELDARSQRDVAGEACLGGAGIGAFYDFHVQDDLREGRLVRVLAEFDSPSRNIFATIPHKKIIRPQAKAFIEFVQELMPKPDNGGTANDISRKRLNRPHNAAMDGGRLVSAD